MSRAGQWADIPPGDMQVHGFDSSADFYEVLFINFPIERGMTWAEARAELERLIRKVGWVAHEISPFTVQMALGEKEREKTKNLPPYLISRRVQEQSHGRFASHFVENGFPATHPLAVRFDKAMRRTVYLHPEAAQIEILARRTALYRQSPGLAQYDTWWQKKEPEKWQKVQAFLFRKKQKEWSF